MITIDETAKERGTMGLVVSFADENGTATAPTTMTWSLVDVNGTVINSRSDVVVTTPEASETIVLSGADLQITTAEQAAGYTVVKRRLVVEITFTSDLGSGLPAKEVAEITVENLPKVVTPVA